MTFEEEEARLAYCAVTAGHDHEFAVVQPRRIFGGGGEVAIPRTEASAFEELEQGLAGPGAFPGVRIVEEKDVGHGNEKCRPTGTAAVLRLRGSDANSHLQR